MKLQRDHLLSWEVVCSSKEQGSLGFGKISLMNHALLGKWLWRFYPSKKKNGYGGFLEKGEDFGMRL